MSKTTTLNKKIPELRFKEFSGEWQEKKLGDVTKINQGLQIAISERYTKKVPNSYFYITNEFLRYGTKKQYYIVNPPKSVVCEPDDILMTRTGNTGQVVTDVSGAFHNNFFKVKMDDKKLARKFLYYFLTSKPTQNLILRLAGTSTIPDLNHGDFYRIPINLPSIQEQQKIAEFLTRVDGRIELQDKKVKLLQKYKKGIMQKIFSQKIRFKDENGKDYPDWQEKKLGELEDSHLLKLGRGKVISKTDIIMHPGNYPIFSSSIKNNGLFGKYGKYMFDEELVTWSIDGGGDFFYRKKQNFSVTNVCGWLRVVNNSLNCKFISLQLQLLHQNKKFDYSTKAHPSVIRQLYILRIPVISEQRKITDFLTSIDGKIDLEENKLAQARQFKKALLQRIFV